MNTKEWQEGFNACNNGYLQGENPYQYPSEKYSEWNSGWCSANRRKLYELVRG